MQVNMRILPGNIKYYSNQVLNVLDFLVQLFYLALWLLQRCPFAERHQCK
jgi:hypothetical protein